MKKAAFKKKDPALFKIFKDSETGKAKYRLATNPVDGTYTGCGVCKGGTSHGGSA